MVKNSGTTNMRWACMNAPLLFPSNESDSSGMLSNSSRCQTPEVSKRKHQQAKPEKTECVLGAVGSRDSFFQTVYAIFGSQKIKMVLRQLRKLFSPYNFFIINFLVLLINLFFVVMQMKEGLWPVESYFQPVLSMRDKALMLTTMKICFKAFAAANISAFMFAGTLIGSYRHHGFIPWDDDIDIIVNGSEKERVIEVLAELEPKYKLYYGGDTSSKGPWKFYSDEIHSKFIHRPFKWPYIDMFFYLENATHIMDEDTLKWYAKTTVFPVTKRPFMDAHLPAPCATRSILDDNFVLELCRSRSFSHMMEVPMFTFLTKDVPCERLANYFPFVYRSAASKGMINETLRMSDWTLSSESLPELPCGKASREKTAEQ